MEHYMWMPGECLAVVTPNGVIVTESGHEELCQNFWRSLHEGVDLGTLLQMLTSAFAANLAALPSFAAVIHESDAIHVAVRGAFEVSVDSPSGTVLLTSGNVITWEEKRIPHAQAWTISSPQVTTKTGQGEARIIHSGIVPVSGVSTDTWTTHASIAPAMLNIDEAPVATNAAHVPLADSVPIASAPSDNDVFMTRAYQDDDEFENALRETSGDNQQEDKNSSTIPTTAPDDAASDAQSDAQATTSPEPAAPQATNEEGPAVLADFTSDMNELFADRTIAAHSVEAAAVREARNDESPYSQHHDTTDIPSTNPTNQSNPYSPPHATPTTTGKTGQDDPESTPQKPTPDGAPTEAAVASSPQRGNPATTPPPGGFFIDSVPTAAPTPPPVSNAHEPNIGSTPTLLTTGHSPAHGDHDGHTVRSDRQEFLRKQAQHIAAGTQHAQGTPHNSGTPDANMVFALLCTNGHPNPTHVNTCHTCEAPMGTATTQVPQPVLGSLHFSTGEVLTLDRDVIVGRRPTYRPQPARRDAHVVPVPSPNQEISRTHCEVTINGWDVRVRDLGSNNGTFLHRPGQAPLRITESSPSILRPGDTLDLGDGVTIRMEAS